MKPTWPSFDESVNTQTRAKWNTAIMTDENYSLFSLPSQEKQRPPRQRPREVMEDRGSKYVSSLSAARAVPALQRAVLLVNLFRLSLEVNVLQHLPTMAIRTPAFLGFNLFPLLHHRRMQCGKFGLSKCRC